VPERSYPTPIGEVMSTLAELTRLQGRSEIVDVVTNANAYFDEINYDNWNGGTSTWALRLEVSLPIFASAEPRLAQLEKEILGKLDYLDRLHPNDPIAEVSITPAAPGTAASGRRMAPSHVEVNRVWSTEWRFRLFLSHLAEHKIAVSKLSEELALFGIAAYVAHVSIRPTAEWQSEIELALQSMQALLALITPEFHASSWTDQEVGWSLGRGVLVVAARLGADPYGFMGRNQGLGGTLEQPKELAKAVFETLLANPRSHGDVRRAYVRAFCESNSYRQTQLLCPYLRQITDFTDEEKVSIRAATRGNSQLSGAYGVRNEVAQIFGELTDGSLANSKESGRAPF
jgi:hypothetical protein